MAESEVPIERDVEQEADEDESFAESLALEAEAVTIRKNPDAQAQHGHSGPSLTRPQRFIRPARSTRT